LLFQKRTTHKSFCNPRPRTKKLTIARPFKTVKEHVNVIKTICVCPLSWQLSN